MNDSLKKYFPIFVLPTLAAFIIGFIIPFILGIYLSFCKFTTVVDAKFVGFSNYIKIFGDKNFLHAIWYTAAFTVVSVILINLFAFIVAMLLTKGFKGTNIFRTVFFMPNLIGGIVLGYIWQIILNGVLARYGVTLQFSATYGFWGLVILMCWQQVGYMMIIYIAGIQNIPTELIEAAKIGGGPSHQSEMLALNIFDTFYAKMGYEGVGQAKAVIFFILVALIAFVQLRATRSREVQQ